MADSVEKEPEQDITRKRKEISSISELDTSGAAFSSPNTDFLSKKQKRKKKKNKDEDTVKQQDSKKEQYSDEKADKEQLVDVRKQLTEINKKISNVMTRDDINKKLSNVITKDDGFLRSLIREIFQEIKVEFLNSVYNRLEILEGRLFERDEENDRLKKSIDTLTETIDNQKQLIQQQKVENKKLQDEIGATNTEIEDKLNDLEQYSRKNNIRVSGIPELGSEAAEVTTEKIIETLNDKIPDLHLLKDHIDVAHRIGGKRKGSQRQIIVKLSSRMKRDEILKNRKMFKGTQIFINEDLSKTNQLVLTCIRKKMPDEVDQAWSRGGRLYYKLKSNINRVIEVPYKDFQSWIDLPWPVKEDNKAK